MKKYIKSVLRALFHPIADLVGGILVYAFSAFLVYCLDTDGLFSPESAVCGGLLLLGLIMIQSFMHWILFRKCQNSAGGSDDE